MLKLILTFASLFVANSFNATRIVPNNCVSFTVSSGTGCAWMCNYCANQLGTNNYYFTDDICVYQSGIRGDDASKGVDCNSILSTYKEITNVTQDLQNYGIGGDYYHDKLTNKIYGPKLGLCGSLYFDYTAFQQSPYVTPTLLSINNDTDLDFRGDDFTVEWWQYTRASGNARIFSIGSYPTVTPDNDTYTTPGASISVSIEGNSEPQNLIVWINSAKYSNGVISGGHTMGTVNLYNRWAHIALVRSNTSTGGLYTVYVDGESIGNTFTGTDDLNDNRPLTIGGEITGDGNTYYSGHITNFRWSKGVARYTNNFDVPILPLTTIDSATKLLLNANDYDSRISDSSGNNKTVSSVGSIPVSWNARNPYFGYKNSNAWVEPRVVYDPPSFVTSLPLGGSTTIWDFSNNFGFNSILIYLSFAVTSTELQISNFVMVAVNRSNTNVVNFKKFDPTNLPSNVTFNVSGTQFKIVSGGVNSEYPYITVKIVALDNTD